MWRKRASLGEEGAQSLRVLAKRSLEEHGEVFQWERASSAQRPHRPEAEPSMAPALGQPCPDIPGLHGYCPRKRQAAGSVRHAREHRWGQPRRAFPLGLGLIAAYLEGRCRKGVSPHCQGLEVGGLWQREEGSKGADAQALARQAVSVQQGEKEATVPLGWLSHFTHWLCCWGSQGAV